ncbi:hypothetical protein AVEN_12513-1 [Araneus ventricosus]|uniref:Uncharacterized protein n=1 Tax=Araneus ventricosus TaxID=182803 RepID=A0A4Y2JG26_ARAVE|nr:hypothetical protein AVEN_12513-1 [Araneus ventricosus]
MCSADNRGRKYQDGFRMAHEIILSKLKNMLMLIKTYNSPKIVNTANTPKLIWRHMFCSVIPLSNANAKLRVVRNCRLADDRDEGIFRAGFPKIDPRFPFRIIQSELMRMDL